MSQSMTYRPEVDGLRAVAVLAVVLSHAGFEWMAGGYLGVDVFFVISGYLITSIVHRQVVEGRFSLHDFYDRRLRRILPALIAVCLVTSVASVIILPPTHLAMYGRNLASVFLFASNIQLSMTGQGYFAPGAAYQPLQHTWSLAVEEQFYLFFPIALFLIHRVAKARMPMLLFLGAAMSLGLAHFWVSSHPTSAYYLLPFRAWELLLGAMLALSPSKPSPKDGLWGFWSLAILLGCMMGFSEQTPTPSLVTLLPVFATTALLATAKPHTLVARILSAKILVRVGLVSYSLYLWHQPVFVFTKMATGTHGDVGTQVGSILLSLGLAWMSWKWVEQPFRNRAWLSRHQIYGYSFLGSVLFLAFGLWVHHQEGLKQRLNPLQRAIHDTYREAREGLAYWKQDQWYDANREDCNFYDHLNAPDSPLPRESLTPSCYQRDPTKPFCLLLWGDSHATALSGGIRSALGEHWQILQVTTSACPPQLVASSDPNDRCRFANAFATEVLREAQPDVVVLAQAEGHSDTIFKPLIEGILARGVQRVLLVGPAPEWVPDCPSVAIRLAAQIPPDERTSLGLNLQRGKVDAMLASHLKATKELSNRSRYLSLMDYFCSQGKCQVYMAKDPKPILTAHDYGHLTLEAASAFALERILPECAEVEGRGLQKSTMP